RESGRRMVEDYALALSPSSTMLVMCSEAAEGKERFGLEKLLSVGNPRFDGAAFPSLPDLPSAAREAVAIAAYYKPPRWLTEGESSVSRVVGEMKGADVVHLALHSVLDERFPLRSKFILSKAPSEANHARARGSALFAYELYGLSLPRTRLAVLSACQTGG